MGAKNLKALAVRGTMEVPVKDAETIKGINRKFLTEFRKSKGQDRFTLRHFHIISRFLGKTGISVPAEQSTVREILRQYGTAGNTVYSALTGDMPVKNWSGTGLTDYPLAAAAKNSDESILSYQKKRYACQSCPLGCGGIIDIKRGRFAGGTGHKPEYETLGALGGLLLHDDTDTIIELNEMANRAGIDTISLGGVIAFAIECFEKGIITEKDTGGISLKWGDNISILQMTELIINREGIGDVLADGVRIAAEKIGGDSKLYAIHAGGQELPMHDSRLDHGYALAYQCEPTPGRHTISCYLYAGLYGLKKKFPSIKKLLKGAKGKTEKQVALYLAATWYAQVINSCGICLFGPLTSDFPIVEYLNAVTGWNQTGEEYLRCGERILNLRKAFNAREGIKPADQKIHRRALGIPPLKTGPLKGVTVNINELEEILFGFAGWEGETGSPAEEKMKELGLDTFLK